MIDFPTEMVESYVLLPTQLFEGSSEDIFIGIADNGNHFLEHGITEGTKLIFDSKQCNSSGLKYMLTPSMITIASFPAST